MSKDFAPPPRIKPLAAHVIVLTPCSTCRWFVTEPNRDSARCHLNPPAVGFPYYDKSYWPVVPNVGGGCGRHEVKA